ncbi:MAG: hypothetical protein ABIF77_20340 [bacterium]
MFFRRMLYIFVSVLILAPAAQADPCGVPDPVLSTLDHYATWQISCLNCPQGDGQDMDGCAAFGGAVVPYPAITLTLLDLNADPIPMYPPEDLWLEAADGGMVFCPGGTIADSMTDPNGETTFTNPLFAGGWSTAGILGIISGVALVQPPLDILVNSPDINASLTVDLTDVILFVTDMFGAYNYRSDLHWDGALDLTDVVLLAQHMQHDCP